MMDNYPMGAANDPDAPYNQADDAELEVERDYDATAGGYTYTSFAEPDCGLGELFAEQQRSALEIIQCCERICKQLLDEGRRRCAKVDLAELRHDCEGWEEMELNVE